MSVDRAVHPGTDPGSDPDDRSSNPSGNRPFREVLAARLSRRDILRGGTMVAAASFLGAAGALGQTEQAVGAPSTSSGRSRPLLGFTPVPTSSADALTVPDGYVAEVLIPWG
ncbi:MAG TPA: hypothetical protein VK942_04605, partial [Actinomycetes bacterium]|nr:hypothetical protein [Actinomycetes bacterium]